MRSTVCRLHAGIIPMVLACSACAATSTKGHVTSDTSTDGDHDADGAATCLSDVDCNDRIACTLDHCEDGTCIHSPCVDCCEDGLECIPGYGCGVVPPPCETDDECSDEIRCTLDRCKDGEYCEHLPQNDLCEEGEICLPAVGCIPEPPDDCETSEDCFMALPCIAEWYCDPEFGCQFLSLIDCDDGDPCTDDTCDNDEGGCVHSIVDADGDGHGDEACGAGDCDDSDPLVHPGAAELCNDVDDDCNGIADDGFECGPAGTVEGCTSDCGTTGTHECLDDCTWGDCVPPAEACNATDDDCDDEVDEDFYCVRDSTRPCTTFCSSTGTQTCRGDCTDYDDCIPPAEVCNGVDDDCDMAADDGFFCVRGGVTSCALLGWYAGSAVCQTDCSDWDETACTDCGNGLIDLGEQCDVINLDGNTCTTLGMGFAGGTLECSSLCTFDTSGCNFCGNLVIDAGEDCDRTNLGGDDCTTLGLGYAGGTLACTSLCVFDTSACNRCGNSTIDSGEQCDGLDMGSQTCTSIPGGYLGGSLGCSAFCTFDTSGCWDCGDGDVNPGEDCDGSDLDGNDCTTVAGGFTGGTLDCRSDCSFDTSACHLCGDDDIDPGEQCDGSDLGSATCSTVPGGFDGGTLGCHADCTYDTTRCTTAFDPSGTYTTAPWVSYTCAYSLVSISFGQLVFIDNGTFLYVDDPGGTLQPCQMQGASAAATGDFDVTCTLPGSCNETYRLYGSFTDATHWTGTFTTSFTGSCLGCTFHSWTLTGTSI